MTKDKSIDNELIDNLLKDYKKPEDLIGENGLLKQLTKQLLERAMTAELTEHVGYEKHDPGGHHSGNSRNGKSAKTLKGTFGTMPIEVPRDRNGSFQPQIIEKHQSGFTGFDDNIISLYARSFRFGRFSLPGPFSGGAGFTLCALSLVGPPGRCKGRAFGLTLFLAPHQ